MSKMIMTGVVHILALSEARLHAMWVSAIGLVVVLVMGAAVLVARRYYVRSQGDYGRVGLDIDALQRLYDDGLLTREEFSRLRLTAMGLEKSVPENSESTSRPHTEVDDVNRDNKDTSSANETKE